MMARLHTRRAISSGMQPRTLKLLFLLLLLGQYAIAQAESTAIHSAHGGYLPGKAKLDVQKDEGTRTLTVLVGPVSLTPKLDHDHAAHNEHAFLVNFDGWFLSYRADVVDREGRTLPGPLLHHVNVYNTGRSNLICPDFEEYIFAAGSELAVWPKVEGVGYEVRRDDVLRVWTMLHNPTETTYPEVYIRVRIEYAERGKDPALKNMYPLWLFVTKCGYSTYDVALGKSLTSTDFDFPYAGRLLIVGGHMHDHAHNLRLQDLGRSRTIADLDAHTDPRGRMLSLPIISYQESGGYRLAPGDRLRVSAMYDNATGKRIEAGGMAAVVAYFVSDSAEAHAAFRRYPSESDVSLQTVSR